MDLQAFVTNFGLPGLLIGVFFLLTKARDERQAKSDERKLELDEKRIDGLFRQAEAMATGFTALVTAMANNHAADIESHSELAAAIAELKGKVDEAIAWRESTTPIGPIPIPTPRRATPAAGSRAPRPGTHHDREDE